MPEAFTGNNDRQSKMIRYRERGEQVTIYLGKFLRMFVYQNDWKVLPMAAVIAGLVALVIRDMFFRTMEGTLMSAFALVCVAIWNGCFNSIQVICRERDVIKREHRAGMHISSYITAHLIYQALLCLLQTAITVYVFLLVGVRFPAEGLFTQWMIVDIGITVFLLTFASDALSLWISSLARNTTTAMTIMPFVLIFQLVFSGGMLTLPAWSAPLTNLTISHYGLTALASQADYNSRPLVTLWGSLLALKDTDVTANVTVGQVLDYLEDEDNPGAKDLRETAFSRTMTVRELVKLLKDSGAASGEQYALEEEMLLAEWGDEPIDVAFTLGQIVDAMAENPETQSERDRKITISTTIGEIISYLGENQMHWAVQQKATAANFNPVYVNTRKNIADCWIALVLYILACASLATVTLEFIDRDKR